MPHPITQRSNPLILIGIRGSVNGADAEVAFRGDEWRLRRMLMNRLDKAVKHTSGGDAAATGVCRARDAAPVPLWAAS